jgi:hypothetical protein
MGMDMMLGDHRSIAALFKAFDSTFSLLYSPSSAKATNYGCSDLLHRLHLKQERTADVFTTNTMQ